MTLRARPVDPRYANDIDEEPSYRVDFWVGNSASEEWRVEGANSIEDVLAWSTEHSDGRDTVIYVETSRNGSLGLARVLGREPT